MKFSNLLFLAIGIFILNIAIYGSSFNICSNIEYKKKVVIITGASRGIGLVTAEYLASQGYIVYGTVRSSSDTAKLDHACELHKGHLFKVILSLTDGEEIQKVFDTIFQEQGRIDVLINNAGYALVGTVESSTIQEQLENLLKIFLKKYM
jgi:NAD(P)-dependent dehydrogenase (short-subunit alcohol dehydrogenase family)